MDYQKLTIDTPNRSRIILNESSLLPRFSQDAHLVCRKAEGERVLTAIKGLSDGNSFHNLFIHGPSGSGKTAMIKWVLSRLEEESRRITCIYSNCWRYSTSMAIYSKIADAIGEPISRRGRASDEIFDRIVELTKSSKKPILLVLDEIEALVQYDNARILHNIARTDEDRALFGVIAISDNSALLTKIPQKTREILRFTKIEIPHYTHDELTALLKERAESGLRPGTYDDSLLEEIADIGVVAKGSGRFASELLWQAARSSEDRGLATISKDELVRARKNLGFEGLQLSREERLIVELLKDGHNISSAIYPLFWDEIPRTKRQIRNYLWAMESKGIIEIEMVMVSNRPKYSIIRLREGFK